MIVYVKMSSLSSIQREILDVLISLYEKKKKSVKGGDIAKMLGRSPGTIRNQMQTLRALGYVEGVPGPKGGYYPAIKAYESMDMDSVEKIRVPVFVNNVEIGGVSARKIVFTKITDAHECGAVVGILGDSRKIRKGDNITVGPTPVNHVILKGEVIGRDDSKRELLIDAHSITSVPEGKARDVATKDLISLSGSEGIRECAKLFVDKRINAAPIIENNQLTGIVTIAEIVRATAVGRTNIKARDIAVENVFTIDHNAELIDCINKMEKHDVGRLIVTESSKPAGIITRTDIIYRMSH